MAGGVQTGCNCQENVGFSPVVATEANERYRANFASKP